MTAAFPALYRDRYGSYLRPNAEPGTMMARLKLVPPKERLGRQYRGPWRQTLSQGITVTSNGGSATLNASILPIVDEYILDHCNLYGREEFSYDEWMRAKAGAAADGGANAAAYMQPFDDRVESLSKGLLHHAELLTLYGCGAGATALSNIGVVATVPVFPGTGANYGSATHPIVQLTHGSFTPTIWDNFLNGKVDILNAAGTAVVETNVTIEGLSNVGPCCVQMFKAASVVAVAAGQQIVPAGWFGAACAGTQAWLDNTGTLANINAALRSLWQPLRIDMNNNKLTRLQMFNVANQLVLKGGGKAYTLYAHPNVSTDLGDEQAPLQRWNDNGVTKMEIGANKFMYSAGGIQITVEPLPYMKQGFAQLIQDGDENVYRIGSSDITLAGADEGDDQILIHRPETSAYELRGMAAFAPFFDYPARNAQFRRVKSTFDAISDGDVT